MGSAQSSNTVNETVKVMTQISNSATQDCVFTFTSEQAANIKATNGSTITINDLNFNEFASVDTCCIQNNQTQNDIQNAIDAQIKQLATAINQSLDFNPGSTSARDVTRLLETLSTDVTNAYTQTCSQNFTGNETANIQASDGSTITINYLNYSDAFESVQSCVLADASVTNTSNRITNVISQKAKAEVESLLGPLLFLLLIILLVVVVVVLGGVKELTNWKFLLTLAIIVIIYLVIASVRGWWPFHAKKNTNSSPPPTNNTTPSSSPS